MSAVQLTPKDLGVIEPTGQHATINDGVLRELAALRPIEYDKVRTAKAKELGVRVSTLDAEVARLRTTPAAADDTDMFPPVNPWSKPVNGAELLTAIDEIVREHVIADSPTVVAATLWIVHTYLLDKLTVSPIAHINAPEKRCGKTVLLSVLGKLVYRPLQASNISAAATYRAIAAWSPTLLVDEADSFLSHNEALRGVLDSGHTRQSAHVIRCDGEERIPRQFSTWCAKAIAGIGRMAGTLEDRSVPLTLRRKLPGESVHSIRRSAPERWGDLRAKLTRWTADNADTIGAAQPDPLPALNDRANDNWEPLIAIADVAGGPWPELARKAALRLSATDDAPAGDELLAAIRDVFENKGADRITSAELVNALAADVDGPWPTWNRGKPITPRQVAKRLREYSIVPTTIRLPSGVTAKGYHLDQFADAWTRYLAPSTTPLSVTTSQASTGAASSDFAIRHTAPPVTDEKPMKAKQAAGCDVVTDTHCRGSEE